MWSISTISLSDTRSSGLQKAIPSRPRAVFDGHTVFVDSTKLFQEILGFGGALTEASGYLLSQLPTQAAEQALEAYFSPTTGHGYTFCRLHLNSCDFSLGNYSVLEREEDHALESFQIDRFREHVLPWLRIAAKHAGQDLKLLVSPWSPPAWMKTNRQMNGGGSLREDCKATWAQCYVRFAAELAKEGLPVWGFTVQNEPDAVQKWDSCIYSAEEEMNFVRDYLGPALAAAGMSNLKILIWDHNRDQLVQRAAVVYADEKASSYIWGTGFHWYGDECFGNVHRHREAWPEKHLLFTEGCQENGPHIDSPIPAERYARAIIRDLNHGTEGWIDWNLLLDETGGPNHVNNLCSAPMIVDRKKKQVLRQPSYDFLGQFSRTIRPGARRILCAPSTDGIEALAVKNLDQSLTVILFNPSAKACEIHVRSFEWEVPVQVPATGLVALTGTWA